MPYQPPTSLPDPLFPQHLLTPENIESGIKDKLYVALVQWFTPDGIQSPDIGSVMITHTHVFSNPLLGFMEMQLAPQKNSLNAKQIGELLGQQFNIQASVFVPGSYVELHENIENLINKPLIVLVKDCEVIYQIGCRCTAAYLQGAFTTGTQKDGAKGYQLTLSAIGGAVVLYSGAITLLAGYPNFGVPIFLEDQPIDNSSLDTVRSAYSSASSINITAIYNAVKNRADGTHVNYSYRDDSGVNGGTIIDDIDISSFSAFVIALQAIVMGYSAQAVIYGTALLVQKSGTTEHYLGISISPADDDTLITEDGSFIITEDGSKIITE